MLAMMGLDNGTQRRDSIADVEGRLVAVRALVELRHPHIVSMRPVTDTTFEPESVDGVTLAELWHSPAGPPPTRIALRILLDTLSGLAAVHNAEIDGTPLGLAHGAISPSCVVVGLRRGGEAHSHRVGLLGCAGL